MDETMFDPTGFEEVDTAELQKASVAEQGFADMYDMQTGYFSDQKKALTTTTFLTALARADPKQSISYQMGEAALEDTRALLEAGKEKQLRYQLIRDKAASQMTSLSRVAHDVDFAADSALVAGADQAYRNVMQWDTERKEKSALEEAAIDRIQQMASTDPIQARVLLDNLEKGNADETVRQFSVKLSLLKQRAEELDETYQQSGWGRFLLNAVLNLVPTNFNFQKTGIIGTAGFTDLLAVGEAQRKESENLWNMPLEDFAAFVAQNGPLMQSIHDNAQSPFDLVDDPGAAVAIMDDLITLGDHDRVWNNVWGGVEIASAVPWTKLASASRSLVGAGAAKDAVRNLDNALTILDNAGPEAMTKATGVVEKDLADELSVSAVKGTDDFVPLSEPVAAQRAAAEQVSKEIFNSPEMQNFRSMEEVQAWIDGRIDEIRGRVGSPIKDVKISEVTLPGGRNVKQLTFTVGKKDGFGFASEAAAKRGLRATGLAGEIFEEVVERTVPKFTPESKVVNKGHIVDKDGSTSYHDFDITTKDGDYIPVSVVLDRKTGAADINVGGMFANTLGAKEIRSIAATIADEIPEIKTFKGSRATGARNVSGANLKDGGDIATVNAETLRGQTRVVRDMSGQYFSKITVDMPETGWLTGQLAPDQQGFLSKMVGRWFQATPRISDSTLHGMSIEAGSYLNRAQRHIQEDVMNVFKGLNRQGKDVVGSLGRLSSIRERWLKPAEIDILVDRQWGRSATAAEQKAYADLRLFNDMDWELRNSAAYLDGVQKGKESVKFKTKWGQEIDEDVLIDYTMDVVPMERVYDASRGKHYVHGRNSLTTKGLKAMNNNGYVMMSFPNGFQLPEGIVVNKLLIKKVDIEISPLRRTQLAYAEGGHRMYTARNFVKQGRKGKQADTGTEYLSTPSTFRTAENIAEARKWADGMNAARIAVKENRAITAQELDDVIFKNNTSYPSGQEFLDGIIDDTYNLDHPFEAVFDRELPSMYNASGKDVARMFNEDELGINGYYRTTGRMYTSSKGEILRDTKGEVADILDPFDTLSRSLSQVTRQIGMFNYKMNAMERFQRTYSQFLDGDPNIRSASQTLTDAKVSATVSPTMRNQIEAQRAAILNVLRFETPADRSARQMWQETAEKVIGDGDNAGRKFAHDALWWWKDANPLGAMRGLAFDMKLGMFNIGQLIVQSSTMLSALAISPKFGMQGMAGLMPMHAYILKGGSEAVLDTMAKRGVHRVMGFESVDEFKEYARHAYKHGFMEMNGSHIMINNYGPNAHFGSFGEKATRAREQARVFFYTSETWNRLVAYRIAWGEARAKGLRPNMPEFNSTILKTADDYSFNMTNESAAYWQKGILSIPTQFWAYNMRMLDAMTGSRFTAAQKARLIGMNFGMAGAAGIPGVQAISEYIKQQTGKAPDIDSLQGVLDRGVIDYLNYQATGNDVIIGERVGTGGWATDVVKSLTGNSEYGTQSFADVAGGATYSIAKNTSKTLFGLAKYFVAESGDPGVGPITTENLINVLKEVSTFSNTSKAMMIHQYGMYKSNSGTVLVSDLPPDQAFYAALSFRPAKADEIGYMLAWEKNKADSVKEISKKLRNWRQEALVTGEYEKYWTKANTLIQLVPIQDRREIIRKTNQTDQESFYDYLEEKVSEEQTEQEIMEGLE